jgi:hypothetical protein
MLDFPGPWTGSSSSTHPPTGQPVRHATFNTTLPTGQSALRCVTPDWSTSPPILFPSGPRSPLPPPNPPKATQPTGLALSPPLPALPRRRASVAPPCNPQAAWRGLSPRGEVLDHPPRGQAKCTTGPETPPCRRRAPALTLRACQRPAVPTAHPPPVRERRAPCPVRLAQSCLSTYSPTPSASRMVKVV